jgi:hypothetical protein
LRTVFVKRGTGEFQRKGGHVPQKNQRSGNPTLIPLKEEKRKGKKFLERKKVPPV